MSTKIVRRLWSERRGRYYISNPTKHIVASVKIRMAALSARRLELNTRPTMDTPVLQGSSHPYESLFPPLWEHIDISHQLILKILRRPCDSTSVSTEGFRKHHQIIKSDYHLKQPSLPIWDTDQKPDLLLQQAIESIDPNTNGKNATDIGVLE